MQLCYLARIKTYLFAYFSPILLSFLKKLNNTLLSTVYMCVCAACVNLWVMSQPASLHSKSQPEFLTYSPVCLGESLTHTRVTEHSSATLLTTLCVCVCVWLYMCPLVCLVFLWPDRCMFRCCQSLQLKQCYKPHMFYIYSHCISTTTYKHPVFNIHLTAV